MISAIRDRGLAGGLNAAPRMPKYFRASTRIKVIAHTGVLGAPVDISQYVIQCITGKNIKGAGQANLALVAARNWHNVFTPNDYVNIYFNQGDGEGWVRTFYGLVDRVEENMEVDGEGVQRTIFHVICSDFAKVPQTTNIYYNPWVNANTRMAQAFRAYEAKLNFMSSGLLLTGTPGDAVANALFVFLGFGNQFAAPVSYIGTKSAQDLVEINRGLRREFALTMIPRNLRGDLMTSEGLDALIGDSRVSVQSNLDSLRAAQEGEARDKIVADISERTGLKPELITASLDEPEFAEALLVPYIKASLLQELGEEGKNVGSLMGSYVAAAAMIAARSGSIASGASPLSQVSILDLINVGTFVERETMDGWTTNISVGETGQSVDQLIRSFSNDIVNELFFDLRAWSEGASNTRSLTDGSVWARHPDELSGNVSDKEGEATGITHYPALVMREYPFGTIHEIDGSAIQMSLGGGHYTYGVFPVGAIFSDRPNRAGRHVIPFPNLNSFDSAHGRAKDNPGAKHLDVAVISESEIMKSNFGKSDSDHFNILEISATEQTTNVHTKGMMSDLFPLITPIHIVKHGVRVMQRKSRYAWVHMKAPTTTAESALGSGTTTSGESTVVPPSKQSTDVIVPISAADILGVIPGHESYSKHYVFAPYSNTLGDKWGYTRQRKGHPKYMYFLHNGIDIRAPVGTPVRAIADGKVIMMEGTRGYGRAILLLHTNIEHRDDKERNWASLYGHLGVPKYLQDRSKYDPDDGCRGCSAKGEPIRDPFGFLGYLTAEQRRGYADGLAVGKEVKKGDVIGFVGWTAFGPTGDIATEDGGHNGNLNVKAWAGKRYYKEDGKLIDRYPGRSSGHAAHLHFEILRARKKDATSRRAFYPAGNQGNDRLDSRDVNIRNSYPILLREGSGKNVRPLYYTTRESAFEKTRSKSLDPERWYLEGFGIDFRAAVASTTPVLPPSPAPGDDDFVGPVLPPSPAPGDDDFVGPLPATDNGDYEFDADDDEPGPEDVADIKEVVDRSGVENQEEEDAKRATPRRDATRNALDAPELRRLLARWGLLQDHWYQHNLEYLSGNITMRGAPEIRVGYRLDIVERNMSMYVESVNHTWTPTGGLTTTLNVTRGQSNNPHPVYVLPIGAGAGNASNQRIMGSRLSKSMIIPDPAAVLRSRMFNPEHREMATVTYEASFHNSVDWASNNDPGREVVVQSAVTTTEASYSRAEQEEEVTMSEGAIDADALDRIVPESDE